MLCFLKGYCGTMPLLLFTFCSVLSKTKNNVKNTLFTSIPVRIMQNNQIFVKDHFAIRRIAKIFFYRDVPDKMAASSKLSPQCYGVTVIL